MSKLDIRPPEHLQEVYLMAMNVSLTPQLENLVRRKVASGMYNSSSEVVREALRLLEERDRVQELKLEKLRLDVQQGLDSLDQGLGREVDFDSIKRRGRERLSALKEGRSD